MRLLGRRGQWAVSGVLTGGHSTQHQPARVVVDWNMESKLGGGCFIFV